MHLDPPLSNLIKHCETICVAECCGIDAYEFSPIHIASFLRMHRGSPDEGEIATIRGQIEALRENYGRRGASACGVTIEAMNQGFTGEEIDRLAADLLTGIDMALALTKECERLIETRPNKSE